MKQKLKFLLLYFFVAPLGSFAQKPTIDELTITKDTASVNLLLRKSKEKLGTSPDSAISLAMQAKSLADEINYPQGKALSLKNIGLGYYYQGKSLETLDYWTQSLAMYESLKDETGVANLLSNIGAVYSDQGDDVKALDYALRSLSIAEKLGDKLRILSALNLVGNIYSSKDQTKDKALEYLLRALPLCEEIGNNESLGVISENIGQLYFEKGNYLKAQEYFKKAITVMGDNANAPFAYNGIGKTYLKQGNVEEALKYHNQALNLAEKLDVKIRMVEAYQGIANVYNKKSDLKTAIYYYIQAENLANELKYNPRLKEIYEEMASTYEKAGDYKNAYVYQTRLNIVKDSLFNETSEKKLGALQFEFDLQKKQNEITLLTKDKDLQAVSLKRQKLAKNAFMIGLVLAFTIALLIFRSYRIKAKTHKILDRQKNEIENLLLNILPVEVAHELKTTGHSTPRQYESVSVMFTDFKGFTTIADKMPPDDLVKELDDCFIAFDGIIEKYNLEKIKTIGDSYMCAGGIPTPDETHVLKMVKAGLEIQQYVASYNERREENGLEPWLVRIGIHVGPVVAGVVGKKKYAYDIWGSSVNIASRMESNGEPGKVNISSATYELIKDFYECSYRGKISAKNIGEIDMYFIEHEYSIPKTLLFKENIEATQ
ncbi:MAG: tetratricopeptide repeat protein [Bacteroidetes bacterium]|nr:MAG: tetratricopeptide repeat protein [Bacteroidota bacterium]